MYITYNSRYLANKNKSDGQKVVKTENGFAVMDVKYYYNVYRPAYCQRFKYAEKIK